MKKNTVAWFEIAVADMTRAKTFYNKVFDIDIQVTDFGGVLMGWFPDAGQVPGAPGS
jgi:predicted enzyme related to lactoylglutathione lyase